MREKSVDAWVVPRRSRISINDGSMRCPFSYYAWRAVRYLVPGCVEKSLSENSVKFLRRRNRAKSDLVIDPIRYEFMECCTKNDVLQCNYQYIYDPFTTLFRIGKIKGEIKSDE